jgi:MFS family permease
MGDYRCDTSGAFNTVQSITFLAQALSMTVFTFFTESLGRKKSLLLSLFMGLVGVIIIFFCNSVSLLTVGVFLGFAGI